MFNLIFYQNLTKRRLNLKYYILTRKKWYIEELVYVCNISVSSHSSKRSRWKNFIIRRREATTPTINERQRFLPLRELFRASWSTTSSFQRILAIFIRSKGIRGGFLAFRTRGISPIFSLISDKATLDSLSPFQLLRICRYHPSN